MTNLACNNCHTAQKAKVLEVSIPLDCPNYSDYGQFFILMIEKCSKCGQKKMFSVGLTNLGNYVNFDYIKSKHFDITQKRMIRELNSLPVVKKTKDKKGFYLNCNEYGAIKRCYSNLSTLKLGLFDIDNSMDIGYVKSKTAV